MRRLIFFAMLVACRGSSGPQTPSAKDIFQRSSPSIVRIEVGQDRVGTGFILDQQGLVATNLHVIIASADITVKMKDGTKYPVTAIAGIDPKRDLAIVRIAPPKPLPVLRLGDSDRMDAGDTVYAIGNPLGVFEQSITGGLISARRNECEGLPANECTDVNVFQFSAQISQGSSGGPLFNQRGEVIGVTTAIVTAGQGINFAIPTNYLKPMMASPRQIQPAVFEKETKELLAAAHNARGGSNEDEHANDPLPKREIPDHPTALLDGCPLDEVEMTITEISSAISRGAPEYNKRTAEGFENCFRIYEGASLKIKSKIQKCKGVTAAFDTGLGKAEKIETYRDKAWALRDTFDGLIKVADRWCGTDPACMAKAKQLQQQQPQPPQPATPAPKPR